MTVLVWGVPSESPVRMITEALRANGADCVSVPPEADGVEVSLAVDPAGRLSGGLRIQGRAVPWQQLSGVYVRPVEPELSPRLRQLPGEAAQVRHARAVHDALIAFTEVAADGPYRVANRLSAMGSNMSKPFQAQLIARHGFAVPETLVTDSAEEALDFADRHDGVVYKSTSGIRSIVTVFDPAADRSRLNRLRWCPVQFQERIDGPDVRVHVIGGEVYPAIVGSTAVDYRYARAQVGQDATLQRWDLPDEWAERCVALAADLDLPFAGIDLKLCPDGRVVCFEVNPSPGFPWYETAAGLPISDAVARWLVAA
ncbi:ATP-grasp domain-containing protein [Nakamurella lactea]|uniref:ATP-grasp domain-containing protein n=1 Tax=Nakamurella lactea TaxID=459515 RepID=UPI00049180F2|nr:hypothetical protein [Nakamurella lactea]